MATGAAASVKRPKQDTDTITPAAKLKSRLASRPESRRNSVASVPPSPVPPMPAAAVTSSVVHKPIVILSIKPIASSHL